MKKVLISILLLSTALTALLAFTNTQDKKVVNTNGESYDLTWKIEKDQTLAYETVMTEIGESEFEMNFGGVFKDLSENSDEDESRKKSKEFFNKLKDFYTNTNLVTNLSNSVEFEDVFDVEMIAIPKEEKEENDDEMTNMMNSMMKGIMLRGSFYKSGRLHSFWVKSAQKNLLSLFFELPTEGLKVGDSWTLDNVNFIGNDQNFKCLEAEKHNKVLFSEIVERNKKKIAVLEYDILEYVSGDFNTPSFFGKEAENTPTTMKFIYKAKAEFSIADGKWISYNGIMSLDATGALTSTQRQKFALVEQE